jgi:GDP-L-fucose synthase
LNRVIILGHRGMVGAAIRRLIPDADVLNDWDLRSSESFHAPLYGEFPDNTDVLYLCAARVGGIGMNMAQPGTMIYDNLMIQSNVIEAARLAEVKLVVFLGSSCIYPLEMPLWEQGDPLSGRGWCETDLLTSPLEPTNEAYAIAKIAGIKMLEAYKAQYGMEYLAVMPCNMYGPGDNFDPDTAHFLPAMIRKFHDAKVSGEKLVPLWGTGTPQRELMHVDDCARIITELVGKGVRGLINIGTGFDEPIRDYADMVRLTVGFQGGMWFDDHKPDGTQRKLLDVSRMKSYGCEPKIGLGEGLASTYRWFLENKCGASAAGSGA